MQPDIEIYVLSCPTTTIVRWISSVFTVIKQHQPSSLCTKVTASTSTHEFEITILEQAAGKRFTSVWFDSDQTPWENDRACAQEAFQFLQCEVRCNAQSWDESTEEDPDLWWRINDHEEGPFIWN